MAEGIPPNFGKPWFESDVVLLTENAEDKKLYANKTVLSVFSPMMRAMFTGGFKEAYQDSVEIHVDYEAMKEILLIIFQVNRDFTRGQPLYEPTLLMELYKAADFLDFPLIRKMCLEQIHSRPSADMAFAAMECDLHDILMETLDRMDYSNLENFLNLSSASSTHRIFTKLDLTLLLKKFTGYSAKKNFGQRLPTILSFDIPSEAMRIDLTKKWFACDVAFRTKNSDGRLLYANKGTLAMVSPRFRELLFNGKMACKLSEMKINEPSDCFLPYEYATVKTILFLAHKCIKDGLHNAPIFYHPALLYDMYRAAAKDHLDIPMVQKFCVAKLLKQGGLLCYEVAAKLNLDIQEELMESMSNCDLFSFVTSRDLFTYLEGDKVVVISSTETDPVLTLNDLQKNLMARLQIYLFYD